MMPCREKPCATRVASDDLFSAIYGRDSFRPKPEVNGFEFEATKRGIKFVTNETRTVKSAVQEVASGRDRQASESRIVIGIRWWRHSIVHQQFFACTGPATAFTLAAAMESGGQMPPVCADRSVSRLLGWRTAASQSTPFNSRH